MWGKKKNYLRLTALFTAIVFSCPLPSWAQSGVQATGEATSPAPLRISLDHIRVPDELGSIGAMHLGAGDETIVLIQDAHSIPDAQRSIQRLIEYFESQYGIHRVALEGASSSLDPQIFRSFPDQKLLKRVFEEYRDAGELAGGPAAAIFSPHNASYFGIEDWDLYEEGIRLYQEALSKEQELTSLLTSIESNLLDQSKTLFSPNTQKLQDKRTSFQKNEIDLIEYVKSLKDLFEKTTRDSIAAPFKVGARHAVPLQRGALSIEKNTFRTFSNTYPELNKILLSEKGRHKEKSPLHPPLQKGGMGGFEKSQEDFDAAQTQMIQAFKERILPKLPRETQIELNQMIQLHNIGHLSQGMLVKRIEDLSREFNFTFRTPEVLKPAVTQARTLESIKGTKLFEELETLEEDLRKTLPQTNEERALLKDFHHLELLKRLAKLELTRKEWRQIADCGLRSAEGGMKNEERGMFGSIQNLTFNIQHLESLFSPHFRFYALASQRDTVLFNNLLKFLNQGRLQVKSPLRPPLKKGGTGGSAETHPPLKKGGTGGFKNGARHAARGAILVAGGFHSESLAAKLKEKNISYLLIAPRMNTIPDETQYRNHMKGEVSWKDYFEIENGRVNLYNAFVRAARDRLLNNSKFKTSAKHRGGSATNFGGQNSKLLKSWRDQIIRDLADQNRIEDSSRYTRFLDELSTIQNFRHTDDGSVLWRTKFKTSARQRGGSATNFGGQNSLLMTEAAKFADGIRNLHSSGNLTQDSILRLLRPATTQSLLGGAAPLEPSANASRYLVFPDSVRSETRQKEQEAVGSRQPAVEPVQSITSFPSFPGLTGESSLANGYETVRPNAGGSATLEIHETRTQIDWGATILIWLQKLALGTILFPSSISPDIISPILDSIREARKAQSWVGSLLRKSGRSVLAKDATGKLLRLFLRGDLVYRVTRNGSIEEWLVQEIDEINEINHWWQPARYILQGTGFGKPKPLNPKDVYFRKEDARSETRAGGLYVEGDSSYVDERAKRRELPLILDFPEGGFKNIVIETFQMSPRGRGNIALAIKLREALLVAFPGASVTIVMNHLDNNEVTIPKKMRDKLLAEKALIDRDDSPNLGDWSKFDLHIRVAAAIEGELQIEETAQGRFIRAYHDEYPVRNIKNQIIYAASSTSGGDGKNARYQYLKDGDRNINYIPMNFDSGLIPFNQEAYIAEFRQEEQSINAIRKERLDLLRKARIQTGESAEATEAILKRHATFTYFQHAGVFVNYVKAIKETAFRNGDAVDIYAVLGGVPEGVMHEDGQAKNQIRNWIKEELKEIEVIDHQNGPMNAFVAPGENERGSVRVFFLPDQTQDDFRAWLLNSGLPNPSGKGMIRNYPSLVTGDNTFLEALSAGIPVVHDWYNGDPNTFIEYDTELLRVMPGFVAWMNHLAPDSWKTWSALWLPHSAERIQEMQPSFLERAQKIQDEKQKAESLERQKLIREIAAGEYKSLIVEFSESPNKEAVFRKIRDALPQLDITSAIIRAMRNAEPSSSAKTTLPAGRVKRGGGLAMPSRLLPRRSETRQKESEINARGGADAAPTSWLDKILKRLGPSLGRKIQSFYSSSFSGITKNADIVKMIKDKAKTTRELIRKSLKNAVAKAAAAWIFAISIIDLASNSLRLLLNNIRSKVPSEKRQVKEGDRAIAPKLGRSEARGKGKGEREKVEGEREKDGSFLPSAVGVRPQAADGSQQEVGISRSETRSEKAEMTRLIQEIRGRLNELSSGADPTQRALELSAQLRLIQSLLSSHSSPFSSGATITPTTIKMSPEEITAILSQLESWINTSPTSPEEQSAAEILSAQPDNADRLPELKRILFIINEMLARRDESVKLADQRDQGPAVSEIIRSETRREEAADGRRQPAGKSRAEVRQTGIVPVTDFAENGKQEAHPFKITVNVLDVAEHNPEKLVYENIKANLEEFWKALGKAPHESPKFKNSLLGLIRDLYTVALFAAKPDEAARIMGWHAEPYVSVSKFKITHPSVVRAAKAVQEFANSFLAFFHKRYGWAWLERIHFEWVLKDWKEREEGIGQSLRSAVSVLDLLANLDPRLEKVTVLIGGENGVEVASGLPIAVWHSFEERDLADTATARLAKEILRLSPEEAGNVTIEFLPKGTEFARSETREKVKGEREEGVFSLPSSVGLQPPAAGSAVLVSYETETRINWPEAILFWFRQLALGPALFPSLIYPDIVSSLLDLIREAEKSRSWVGSLFRKSGRSVLAKDATGRTRLFHRGDSIFTVRPKTRFVEKRTIQKIASLKPPLLKFWQPVRYKLITEFGEPLDPEKVYLREDDAKAAARSEVRQAPWRESAQGVTELRSLIYRLINFATESISVRGQRVEETGEGESEDRRIARELISRIERGTAHSVQEIPITGEPERYDVVILRTRESDNEVLIDLGDGKYFHGVTIAGSGSKFAGIKTVQHLESAHTQTKRYRMMPHRGHLRMLLEFAKELEDPQIENLKADPVGQVDLVTKYLKAAHQVLKLILEDLYAADADYELPPTIDGDWRAVMRAIRENKTYDALNAYVRAVPAAQTESPQFHHFLKSFLIKNVASLSDFKLTEDDWDTIKMVSVLGGGRYDPNETKLVAASLLGKLPNLSAPLGLSRAEAELGSVLLLLSAVEKGIKLHHDPAFIPFLTLINDFLSESDKQKTPERFVKDLEDTYLHLQNVDRALQETNEDLKYFPSLIEETRKLYAQHVNEKIDKREITSYLKAAQMVLVRFGAYSLSGAEQAWNATAGALESSDILPTTFARYDLNQEFPTVDHNKLNEFLSGFVAGRSLSISKTDVEAADLGGAVTLSGFKKVLLGKQKLAEDAAQKINFLADNLEEPRFIELLTHGTNLRLLSAPYDAEGLEPDFLSSFLADSPAAVNERLTEQVKEKLKGRRGRDLFGGINNKPRAIIEGDLKKINEAAMRYMEDMLNAINFPIPGRSEMRSQQPLTLEQQSRLGELASSQSTYGNPANKELYRTATALLSISGTLAIDVGSGDNNLPAEGLEDRFDRVVRVDNSDQLGGEGREGVNIEKRQGDATHLPFEKGSVDLVVHNQSLSFVGEYVTNSDLGREMMNERPDFARTFEENRVIPQELSDAAVLKAIKESFRVLKPGGSILIKPGSHLMPFDLRAEESKTLIPALQAAGFEDIQVITVKGSKVGLGETKEEDLKRMIQLFRWSKEHALAISRAVDMPVFIYAVKPRAETRAKLIKDVPAILKGAGDVIWSETDVPAIVEEPLVKAVQTLFRKNIRTFTTTANSEEIAPHWEDKISYAVIGIDARTLGEENRKILEGLNGKKWKFGSVKAKIYDDEGDEGVAFISIPIQAETTVEELSRFAASLAERFKLQELRWNRYTLNELRKIYVTPEATLEDFKEFYDAETSYFYLSEEQMRNAKRWEALQSRSETREEETDERKKAAEAETRPMSWNQIEKILKAAGNEDSQILRIRKLYGHLPWEETHVPVESLIHDSLLLKRLVAGPAENVNFEELMAQDIKATVPFIVRRADGRYTLLGGLNHVMDAVSKGGKNIRAFVAEEPQTQEQSIKIEKAALAEPKREEIPDSEELKSLVFQAVQRAEETKKIKSIPAIDSVRYRRILADALPAFEKIIQENPNLSEQELKGAFTAYVKKEWQTWLTSEKRDQKSGDQKKQAPPSRLSKLTELLFGRKPTARRSEVRRKSETEWEKRVDGLAYPKDIDDWNKKLEDLIEAAKETARQEEAAYFVEKLSATVIRRMPHSQFVTNSGRGIYLNRPYFVILSYLVWLAAKKEPASYSVLDGLMERFITAKKAEPRVHAEFRLGGIEEAISAEKEILRRGFDVYGPVSSPSARAGIFPDVWMSVRTGRRYAGGGYETVKIPTGAMAYVKLPVLGLVVMHAGPKTFWLRRFKDVVPYRWKTDHGEGLYLAKLNQRGFIESLVHLSERGRQERTSRIAYHIPDGAPLGLVRQALQLFSQFPRSEMRDIDKEQVRQLFHAGMAAVEKRNVADAERALEALASLSGPKDLNVIRLRGLIDDLKAGQLISLRDEQRKELMDFLDQIRAKALGWGEEYGSRAARRLEELEEKIQTPNADTRALDDIGKELESIQEFVGALRAQPAEKMQILRDANEAVAHARARVREILVANFLSLNHAEVLRSERTELIKKQATALNEYAVVFLTLDAVLFKVKADDLLRFALFDQLIEAMLKALEGEKSAVAELFEQKINPNLRLVKGELLQLQEAHLPFYRALDLLWIGSSTFGNPAAWAESISAITRDILFMSHVPMEDRKRLAENMIQMIDLLKADQAVADKAKNEIVDDIKTAVIVEDLNELIEKGPQQIELEAIQKKYGINSQDTPVAQYRIMKEKLKSSHPDMGGNAETFRRAHADFRILEQWFKKEQAGEQKATPRSELRVLAEDSKVRTLAEDAAEVFARYVSGKINVDDPLLLENLSEAVYAGASKDIEGFLNYFIRTVENEVGVDAAQYVQDIIATMRGIAEIVSESYKKGGAFAVSPGGLSDTEQAASYGRALEEASGFVEELIYKGKIGPDMQKIFKETGVTVQPVKSLAVLDSIASLHGFVPLLLSNTERLQGNVRNNALLQIGMDYSNYRQNDLSQFEIALAALLQFVVGYAAINKLSAEEVQTLNRMQAGETIDKKTLELIEGKLRSELRDFPGISESNVISFMNGTPNILVSRIQNLVTQYRSEQRVQVAA